MKLDLSNRTIRQHERAISHNNFWRILGDMVIAFIVILVVDYLIDQLLGLTNPEGFTVRVGLAPVLDFISTLASSLFSMGIMWGLVDLTRQGGPYDQGSLVKPYKEKLGRNILALLLLSLISFIPTFLVGILSGLGLISADALSMDAWQVSASFFAILVVAWIILSIILTWLDLSLALVAPLLGDHPDMGPWQVMKESFRLMKGNRWKLLGLILSYIWFPLLIIILGTVAFFYVAFFSSAQGANIFLAISLFFFVLLIAALLALYYGLRLNVARALFYTALVDKDKATSCFPG
ncbi:MULTISPECIES: DUF975 family protein [Aerococcus]|uniref:DUF975 family protein n=1 Tax=Aerococcus sanguinicola TaxID=119206 RepID=A0A5N1GQ49_9LACT|nr:MULTISPECIES: DUF975 family protein [Aerococcus]KAA9302171.1 DUF975 family protein [Aerococcus sanguinicola]MDK6368399.1 DUF975 family protein [Aerococcus sp. UMB9870]MDK6679481.1 DUF975 family protein [Aerococcus sp. UMB8608]MDK6687248.1 DUF975 family protein [Aerococcus sp. UMB8623]MDK6941054.1 DUF975 family protein [Aerococcus sp. UMB8487]